MNTEQTSAAPADVPGLMNLVRDYADAFAGTDMKDALRKYEVVRQYAETLASFPQPTGARPDADERMRHDYPILQQFHTKHALGALSAPSCLCCGQSTQGREVAIRHAELPAIVICKQCRDRATGASDAMEPVAMQDAPKVIYLVIEEPDFPEQSFEDYRRQQSDGVRWCEDRNNDEDIAYVRADLARPLPAQASAPMQSDAQWVGRAMELARNYGDERCGMTYSLDWLAQEKRIKFYYDALRAHLLTAPASTVEATWDASQIKQPGWNHVQQAFIDGAREARANPDATETDFGLASDGYTKRIFEEVDPASEAALRTGSWKVEATSAPVAAVEAAKPARTFTDSKGEKWSFDPACSLCHGHGSFIAGHSGREDDGNAPIWEDCDCFFPIDAAGVSPPPSSTAPASAPDHVRFGQEIAQREIKHCSSGVLKDGDATSDDALYELIPPPSHEWLQGTASPPPAAWQEGWEACRNNMRTRIDAAGVKHG